MTKIQDLLNAGIPVIEAESNEVQGSYSFGPRTDQQILQTELILASPAEVAKRAIFDGAPAEMATVGNGWPAYTREQALDWVETNIGTPLAAPIPANPMTVQQIRAVLVAIIAILGTFKTMNIAMIKMIIALRNRTF